MPALSFHREWIDALLTGNKTQTTRKPQAEGKPPRLKVGDLCHIYVEQRGKINAKPQYPTTVRGREVVLTKMIDGKYPILASMSLSLPPRYSDIREYYAHFLGIVEVTEAFTIKPSTMTGENLEAWAWADGFFNFDAGDRWFVKHHTNETWMDQRWNVYRWGKWTEKYFEPKEFP